MSVKIAIIAIGTIIALIGGGLAIKYTILKSTPEIPIAFSVVFKANGATNNITISYGSAVNLEWESKGATRCFASGDWSGILPASGSQTIENIKESKNYNIKCVNEKNDSASAFAIISIGNALTSSSSVSQTINKDSFKNFVYNWEKTFCLNSKNNSDVAALQTVLYIEEFFDSADKITGVFNNETSIALRKFQESYSIDQTGCADQETINKLNELYGAGDITDYSYSYPPSQSDSSSKSSSLRPILGNDFSVNDLVKTTVAAKLRDDNCREIGTITAGTLLKIISPEIKYCVIGNKKFQMRKIQAVNTGQIGWLAAIYLEKTSIISSNNGNGNDKNDTPRISVDLKANGSDKTITVPISSLVTLSWISTSTVSCETSGSGWGEGTRPNSGEEKIDIGKIVKNKYFKLTCYDKNGKSAFDSISVYASSTSSGNGGNNGNDSSSTPPPHIDELKPDIAMAYSTADIGMGKIPTLIKIKGSYFNPFASKIIVGSAEEKPKPNSDENTLLLLLPPMEKLKSPKCNGGSDLTKCSCAGFLYEVKIRDEERGESNSKNLCLIPS